MKYFDNSNSKEEILDVIKKMEATILSKGSHLFQYFENRQISIGETVKLRMKDNTSKVNEGKPALILLEVILSANRKYELFVKPRMEKIKVTHNYLNSFEDLNEFLKDENNFFSFCTKDIKKYKVLQSVTSAFLGLKTKYNCNTDQDTVMRWSDEIEKSGLKNYRDDIIGKIENVGIATIQHLRLAFGINTVKPDVHVKRVLKTEFQLKGINNITAIEAVTELSKLSGYDIIRLDKILVNYGSSYPQK